MATGMVIATMIMTAISYGIKAVEAANMKRDLREAEEQDLGQLVNTTSAARELPVLYGQSRVGINIVYKGISGSNARFFHLVGNVCEGEVEGVVEKDGTGQVWLGDKLWNEYKSSSDGHALVHWEFFTGGADQTPCATLHNAISEWNEAKRHTAYIYVRLEYDRNVFQDVPDITLEGKWLKVYDPATSLIAWSDDPALCTRDYLTRSARRGGMGISAARIDDDAVSGAAAYCAAKEWTCNLPIIDNQACIDNLRQILLTYRGAVIFSRNRFKVRYRDLNYEVPVMDLAPDDVVEAGEDSSLEIEQPGIFDTPNAVKIVFLNKEKKYQEDEYPAADPALVAADGDFRQEEIAIRGIDNLPASVKMANYFRERLRVNKPVSFTGGRRCAALEPHDLVRFTHPVPGWSQKILRVEEVKEAYDGNVALSFIEEETAFYDDTYNLQDHSWHDTLLPSPSDPVHPVVNVTHAEEVYYYRMRSFTRWIVSFEPPAEETYPWWDHAEVWVKVGEAGEWKFMTKASSGYMIDPVQEGERYYCRIVSVSIHGAKEDFAAAATVSKYILGKLAAPSSLAGVTAVASGDTVSIYAEEVSDPDIEGYEIRLGNSFAGGILIGFSPKPIWSKSGIKPGTFTFFVAAKDNAGHYSDTPRSATVEVYYPAGYSDKNTWSWDFSTGTHDNTEQTTYGAYTVLKCSHTDGVLSGTWTSAEYDLGSIKTVRVWGDFLTDFAASGLTWDGLTPTPNDWDSLDVGNRSWGEILSVNGAGILNAKVRWGNTSGNLTNEADFFHILAPEITGRYVQVEVTITEATLDANLYLRSLSMRAAYWGT